MKSRERARFPWNNSSLERDSVPSLALEGGGLPGGTDSRNLPGLRPRHRCWRQDEPSGQSPACFITLASCQPAARSVNLLCAAEVHSPPLLSIPPTTSSPVGLRGSRPQLSKQREEDATQGRKERAIQPLGWSGAQLQMGVPVG